MTRTVTVGHERMVERLEEIDETGWRVRYSMLETGPTQLCVRSTPKASR